jgi:hypothetical protein
MRSNDISTFTLMVSSFWCGLQAEAAYISDESDPDDGDSSALQQPVDTTAAHQNACITFLLERLRAVGAIAEIMQVCLL